MLEAPGAQRPFLFIEANQERLLAGCDAADHRQLES